MAPIQGSAPYLNSPQGRATEAGALTSAGDDRRGEVCPAASALLPAAGSAAREGERQLPVPGLLPAAGAGSHRDAPTVCGDDEVGARGGADWKAGAPEGGGASLLSLRPVASRRLSTGLRRRGSPLLGRLRLLGDGCLRSTSLPARGGSCDGGRVRALADEKVAQLTPTVLDADRAPSGLSLLGCPWPAHALLRCPAMPYGAPAGSGVRWAATAPSCSSRASGAAVRSTACTCRVTGDPMTG